MDIQVNYLAVFLAASSSLMVGALWYSRLLFVKPWTKLARIKGDGSMAIQPIAISFVVTLVTAYVLAHVAFLSHSFYQNSFLQDSLTTAFWMWLAFVTARVITHDGFESRPYKLTLITVGNEFVTFLLMGLIIGMIGV